MPSNPLGKPFANQKLAPGVLISDGRWMMGVGVDSPGDEFADSEGMSESMSMLPHAKLGSILNRWKRWRILMCKDPRFDQPCTVRGMYSLKCQLLRALRTKVPSDPAGPYVDAADKHRQVDGVSNASLTDLTPAKWRQMQDGSKRLADQAWVNDDRGEVGSGNERYYRKSPVRPPPQMLWHGKVATVYG